MNNQDKPDELKPLEDDYILNSGWLDVGDGHEIYWVDWGNPKINEPIFYLHGGPGAGFNENVFAKFDPLKHRVIFHDQRGSGRSRPFASTKDNTTRHLIADIQKLINHLGFSKISLYGFSWGSTLALIYAINFPDQIQKMLIGGIYLARKTDNEFYLNGRVASHFPEVWEKFESNVPTKRENKAAYFKERFEDAPDEERSRLAKEWMLYESSLAKLDYLPSRSGSDLKDFAFESLAYLEAHYILNDCFIDENFILKNTRKLRDIEVVIVHGRYDFICMPSAAYELHRALPSSVLQIIQAGHSSSDTVQREVIKAYANMLWK